MRICSLLPSATEILYALGLGDQVVGVSHTCDFPVDTKSKPVVSRSVRQLSHLSSQEIDEIIQQARINNNPVHWIDGDLLKALEPDLIITQELCQVCAIGSGSVFETVGRFLNYMPEIISIRPASLDDIFANITIIGQSAGVPERANALVSDLKQRVRVITDDLKHVKERPKVFCIDWLDPLRNTGQWTPELVELAGGVEGLAEKWGVSRELSWHEVLEYDPDYIMVMPCAFNMERTIAETKKHMKANPSWSELDCVSKGNVFLFDGQIPSRHGPRVIDVLEGLAEAMHPEIFQGTSPEGVFLKPSWAIE
jgi:iron complex transport system substrate-binding protein